MTAKKLVLIVDNSPSQAEFVEDCVLNYLDADEWGVVVARSEAEGREAFQKHQDDIAIVVVDVCLTKSDTDFNGVRLIRWLAEQKPECYRIMVSLKVRDRSLLPANAPIGAFVHTRLEKGYNPVTQLEAALGTAVEQFHAHVVPAGALA